MINEKTVDSAERFVQRRYALLIFLVIVVGVLFEENIRLSLKNDSLVREHKAETTELNLQHKKDLFLKDSLLYDCENGRRIEKDNSTKAAIQNANEFKDLYIRVSEIKNKLKIKD